MSTLLHVHPFSSLFDSSCPSLTSGHVPLLPPQKAWMDVTAISLSTNDSEATHFSIDKSTTRLVFPYIFRFVPSMEIFSTHFLFLFFSYIFSKKKTNYFMFLPSFFSLLFRIVYYFSESFYLYSVFLSLKLK